MHDPTDDPLLCGTVQDESPKKLSTIKEMDEVEDGENSFDKNDELTKFSKFDTKLILETSVDNLENRLSQPETPPEVLRVRLNSLQNEFEELKEFTDLERQTYHSDCIPRTEVKSLENQFELLNEKVKQLMKENVEYQSKLEINEEEQKNLKSEIVKAKSLQNKSMIIISKMKKKLLENIKEGSVILREPEISPLSLYLEEHGNGVEVSYEHFLNALRELDQLVETSSKENKDLQIGQEHFALKVTELNETIERMNQEAAGYQQNLKLVLNFQGKLSVIEEELLNLSSSVVFLEKKCENAENAHNIASDLLCEFQNEKKSSQEKIFNVINTVKSFVQSIINDPYISKRFVNNEDLVRIKSNLKSNDLLSISNTIVFLDRIYQNLKGELKMKHTRCEELQSNIDQLEDHFRKCEEDIRTRKLEIEHLAQEVSESIPSRLLELEGCLNSKILNLQNDLKTANAKVGELSMKLAESKSKENKMQLSLVKGFFERSNLEKEILNLKDRLTIDNVLTDIGLAVDCLENVIDSWDEKSSLENLVNVFQEETYFFNVCNLLMSVKTRAVFSEVAMKLKRKLLVHDEETNNLHSKLIAVAKDIAHLESENDKIRLELSTLNNIVKQGLSDRVNELEKFLCYSDHVRTTNENTNQYPVSEDKQDCLFVAEQDRQREELNPLKPNYDKLKKQINNFNTAATSDDYLERVIYDINEIEKFLDSWDFSEMRHYSEFTQLLNRKVLNYCDSPQNSAIKNDVLRITNKFELKIMELFELNSPSLKSKRSLSNMVEINDENKEFLNGYTNEEPRLTAHILKDKEVFGNENWEKGLECNPTEEIKTIKKMMSLEITSMDESENGESLMRDTVENIFSKLMQIIMIKEQEMSCSILKQKKEEVHKFEQKIENMNNKLKQQDSWIETLESENERMNTELVALKRLNSSSDLKLKAISDDINNKILEVDTMKKQILDLMTENCSLSSDLDSARNLINKYRHSVTRLENNIKELNEELVNKCDLIKHLESKLSCVLDKQEYLENQNNILSSNSVSFHAKGDFFMDKVSHKPDIQAPSVLNYDCFEAVKERNKRISDVECNILEVLGKEIAFINDMLEEGSNGSLSDLSSKCDGNICVLKDLIQNIGSKVSEMEMTHTKYLQPIETALAHRTKEMHDMKLGLSKLIQDFFPNSIHVKKREIIDESLQGLSTYSIQNIVDEIKSDFVTFTNKVEELEESAKTGQNVMQNIREIMQTVVNENNNMVHIINDLRESVKYEQEKYHLQKQRADSFSKENDALQEKKMLLENEIKDLKLGASKIKKELFSGLEIGLPEDMTNSEKITLINNTLKQYADTQKVCCMLTDELRFFSYHCELMLSYIQSLEYKVYFTDQQKHQLERDNMLLKEQLTTQHLEMERFFNQLVLLSPFLVKTQNQVLDVISHVFSEYKVLKENEVKLKKDDKLKQEKILQLQSDLTSLSKQNSSLKFELTKCEDSVRSLRSELRNLRPKSQRRESTCFESHDIKVEKIDSSIQTENMCCLRLQKQIIKQKEKMDTMVDKLTKYEQRQQSSVTSNPYNKQVSYLEAALAQAKEKIGRLHFALKQQESQNQELVDAVKRQEDRQ